MNINFETQGTITYAVYQIQPDDVVDTLGLGMLTNNKIPGLATTQFTQMDNDRFIKFNVSAKIPVSQFFSGQVTRKRLVGVFKGIVAALLSAEEYMIDPNSILLEMDNIFTDVSTCETILICLPVQTNRPPVNLTQFFKNIMFSTQFDQTENCDYVAKIMNYLNSAPTFSLTDFNDLMIRIEQESKGQPAPVRQPAAPAPAAPQPPVQPQQPQAPRPQPQQPQQPMSNPGFKAPVQQPQPNMPKPGGFQQPNVPQPNAAPRPAQGGFAVPGQQPPAPQGFQVPGQAPQQMPNQQAVPGGKKMSFMNLMMHYNKENAAIYKAQKEAAKNGAPMPNMPQQPMPAGKPPKGGKGQPPMPNQGFQVPGQRPNAPTPMQAPNANRPPMPNQGFQVPGQKPGAPTPMQAPMANQPMQAARPVYQPPVSAPVGQPMSFGETTVLGAGGVAGIGETTVLGGGMMEKPQPKPMLIRAKNNERINIDKPIFRIGKERSYVDYFIGDNSAISRSHANIITRDGAYYIMDTNSTNHTYVNGSMIQSNTEVKLEQGYMIRLANEEFEFKIL